ncbi:hypothetical protein F4779DRAFT_636910 [Xylariaceae sp. FL0662B]|nr:hypothetical protein F4779DRAFT_636910 [Xylariaceae sp. FL0662B]
MPPTLRRQTSGDATLMTGESLDLSARLSSFFADFRQFREAQDAHNHAAVQHQNSMSDHLHQLGEAQKDLGQAQNKLGQTQNRIRETQIDDHKSIMKNASSLKRIEPRITNVEALVEQQYDEMAKAQLRAEEDAQIMKQINNEKNAWKQVSTVLASTILASLVVICVGYLVGKHIWSHSI